MTRPRDLPIERASRRATTLAVVPATVLLVAGLLGVPAAVPAVVLLGVESGSPGGRR